MTDRTNVEERERRYQEAAGQGSAGAPAEPEAELYRRVYAAVRAAELPEAPPGFALRLERQVFAPETPGRGEAREEWGVRIGLALLVILTLAAAAPVAHLWLHRWLPAAAPALGLSAAASGWALALWSWGDRGQRRRDTGC